MGESAYRLQAVSEFGQELCKVINKAIQTLNFFHIGGFSKIALAFCGSTLIPSFVSSCPMKVTFFRRNLSFSRLRAMLMQQHLSRNFRSFRSWSKLASSSVFPTPYITISSVMSSTPSRPSRIWLTLFWKISEESNNAKGSLRQRYRPNSVAKVVRRLDSSSRLQCQNHERRSTVEEANEFEQVNMASFLPISDQRLQKIRRKTGKDKTLQIFKTVILQGWPAERKDAPVQVTPYFSVRDELSVQDGLIFRSERVVVPQALRQDIRRQRIHSSHMGYESCLSRARECVFWSEMNAEIREMIAMCKTCRKFEASQPKEPLMPVETPWRPWEKIGVDLFSSDNKDFLITVDYVSNYWEIDKLNNTMASKVVLKLKSHFTRYRCPDQVIEQWTPVYIRHFPEIRWHVGL